LKNRTRLTLYSLFFKDKRYLLFDEVIVSPSKF
jgi:hypothetical protein